MTTDQLRQQVTALIDAETVKQGLDELAACRLSVEVLEEAIVGYSMRADELELDE